MCACVGACDKDGFYGPGYGRKYCVFLLACRRQADASGEATRVWVGQGAGSYVNGTDFFFLLAWKLAGGW